VEKPPAPSSRLLIEIKDELGAASLGFLLALVLSHGGLLASFGARALIAGVGWAGQRSFQRHREERDNE